MYLSFSYNPPPDFRLSITEIQPGEELSNVK